jgi:hypothetical protein
MNCNNCKNPINPKLKTCEWCGYDQHFESDLKKPDSLIQSNEIQYSDKSSSKKYFLPGFLIISVWIFGNLISEKDKHDFFGMDDLSPILIIGVIVLLIGLIIKKVKK